MQDSKTCFKCGVEKKLSDFYRHRGMADGHLGKCKTCTKLDAGKHRKENIEAIREYDRDRGKLDHRKSSCTKITKERRKSVKNYGSAHSKVNYAIKTGKLTKEPCCMCGSIMVQAHHDDYSQPLEIMWLCAVHHKSRHAFLNYIENISK